MRTDSLLKEIEAMREEIDALGPYFDISLRYRDTFIDVSVTRKRRCMLGECDETIVFKEDAA